MTSPTLSTGLAAMLLFLGSTARADGGAVDGGPPPQKVRWLDTDDRRWGIEVDAIRPLLAGQWQVKGTYTAWRSGSLSGELVLGANALFGRVNDDGKQTELQAIVGYRQFFWRGLHVEADFIPGYAAHDSAIDGRSRQSAVVSGEVVAGYRWDIALPAVTFYLLTDAGVGMIVANSNAWPETDASQFRLRTPYFAGNIALGVRF